MLPITRKTTNRRTATITENIKIIYKMVAKVSFMVGAKNPFFFFMHHANYAMANNLCRKMLHKNI